MQLLIFKAMLIVACKGFIEVFSRKATGFHRCAKLFELNFFRGKLHDCILRLSNQASKIILTAGQLARCPALKETPAM